MSLKRELLYEGKAKKIYRETSEKVFVEYKDSLTAFNAQKLGSFEGKGIVNRNITVLLYKYLEGQGVKTHFISAEEPNGIVATEVKIIPLEIVVRNILAGSTAKKFNIEEGRILERPLVEFYFKNDELGDPFISDDQAVALKVVSGPEIPQLKEIALKVNSALRVLFAKANLQLVDFKIEVGADSKGQLLLADEITPDCCRLWDVRTQEKFDKDRFRRDLGRVKESYEEVLKRLENALGVTK
jgi:phosphoribosylaminoimidazole-succinocarboxamide synthase